MLSRLWGVIYQNLLISVKNTHSLQEVLLWPTLDLILWGATSLFISNISGGNQALVMALLGGVIFWTLVWRPQQDVSLMALREIWDRTIGYMFVTPLSKWEFTGALMFFSLIKAVAIIGWMSTVAWLLYQFNIYVFGGWFIVLVSLLIIFGWAAGYLVLGLILRFGSRVDTLAWSFLGIIQPFVGVYYSVAILPEWVQRISMIFPVTYVFENMRSLLLVGEVDVASLWWALGLDIVWLVVCVWFYGVMFEQARKLGKLARMD